MADATLLHGLHPPRHLEASLDSSLNPSTSSPPPNTEVSSSTVASSPVFTLPTPAQASSLFYLNSCITQLTGLPASRLSNPHCSQREPSAVTLPFSPKKGAPTSHAVRERDTISWPAKTLHKPALCTNTQNEGPSQTQAPLTPPCFGSIRTT